MEIYSFIQLNFNMIGINNLNNSTHKPIQFP